MDVPTRAIPNALGTLGLMGGLKISDPKASHFTEATDLPFYSDSH